MEDKKKMFPKAWGYLNSIINDVNEIANNTDSDSYLRLSSLYKDGKYLYRVFFKPDYEIDWNIFEAFKDNRRIIFDKLFNNCERLEEIELDRYGTSGPQMNLWISID